MPFESLFLSAERAEALAAWRCPEPQVVSLNLPIDAAGAYPKTLERLLHEAVTTDPRFKTLSRDLEIIENFVRRGFVPAGRRGLCVYSCVKYGVFEAFATPEPFHASLSVAERPCLKPLEALHGRYHRFLALLADKNRARLVEIYLGESMELESREGDFAGADLPALAARAAKLMRTRRADRLVLGAAAEFQASIVSQLPAEIQSRLILEPLLGPERPLQTLVERVRHNEIEALKVRESVLVQRFLDEVREGGAVAGLEAVTAALQQDCVKLLLVRDGWTKMGRSCPSCGRLSVDHRSCPWCFKATEPVLDLVAKLVERALAAGVEVFPVAHDQRFDRIGHIGAELAAPINARRSDVSTARALRVRFATKDGHASPLRPRPV